MIDEFAWDIWWNSAIVRERGHWAFSDKFLHQIQRSSRRRFCNKEVIFSFISLSLQPWDNPAVPSSPVPSVPRGLCSADGRPVPRAQAEWPDWVFTPGVSPLELTMSDFKCILWVSSFGRKSKCLLIVLLY